MKTYEKYKDSGVEWIGVVPEHWEVVPLKRLLLSSLMYGANESAEEDNDADPRYIRITDINENGKLKDDTFKSLDKSKAKDYLLSQGDILFARSGATVGKTYLFNEKYQACFAGYLIKASCNRNKLRPEYLIKYTQSGIYDNWKNSIFIQATIQNIGADKYSYLPIIVPTLHEQQAIASYLDKKCADIDKVISTQQKRIELLQELKQSTITHAVTRGLDPNVKMKDSGVEWIGMVPEHWDTLRLRFVCELRNGYTPSKANPDFWTDGTIPWYRMEDIRESGRRLKEAKQYVTESAIKGGGLFEAGSFIMATTATIGEHAVLIVDSLANQQFTNLKIRKSLSHSDFKEFFFQYLFVVDDYCKTTTKTATFPAVNMEDLKNFVVCIPPKNEQNKILAYLDKKCSDLDSSISKAQHEIDLLQEYKQSLITEVVTGKHKVC